MDFNLTDEQRMLQDTLERLISSDYTFEQRADFITQTSGFSRDNWRKFAEIGILGLPFTEDSGGFGGGGTEQMVIMQALGRGLVVEPFISCVLTAGRLLERTGNAGQIQAYLPELIAGNHLLAFAHAEPGSRYHATDVQTTAKRHGDHYVLNGVKAGVAHGDSAQTLLVSARTNGAQRDSDGISLFIVDASAEGMEANGHPTVDGQRTANIQLDDVQVGTDALLGEEGGALADIEYIHDCVAAALCADSLGAATAATELTLEYLKTRKQFGVPIGSFQALQHRAVDMHLELEQMRSMAIIAASHIEDETTARKHYISAAKYKVDRAARFIGQQAIQLHGGIGMTEEYAVGHYFKRTTTNERRMGDPDHHLRRFMATA